MGRTPTSDPAVPDTSVSTVTGSNRKRKRMRSQRAVAAAAAPGGWTRWAARPSLSGRCIYYIRLSPIYLPLPVRLPGWSPGSDLYFPCPKRGAPIMSTIMPKINTSTRYSRLVYRYSRVPVQ